MLVICRTCRDPLDCALVRASNMKICAMLSLLRRFMYFRHSASSRPEGGTMRVRVLRYIEECDMIFEGGGGEKRRWDERIGEGKTM
jgi:hypothetical protein